MKSLDIRIAKTRKQAVTKTRRTSLLAAVIGTFSVGVLIAAGAAFYILPEATIRIVPKNEALTRDLEVRVDKNQIAADAAALVIPGKVAEQEINKSSKFSATGRKNIGRVASGFVNIYNLSKTNLILKKDTTVLESSSGRRYYFTQDVGNIRPTAFIGLQDQEIDSSSLIPPVPVVAADPGEQYNLPSDARLEIRNEAFGYQPKVLYAAAADAISGGTTQEIKVVSEKDVNAALATLQEEILKDAKREIKFLDNAVNLQILDQAVSVPVGTETAEFEGAMKAQIKGLVFAEEDLLEIFKKRLQRLLPENKNLLNHERTKVTASFLSADLAAGAGVLAAHFEGMIVYQLNPQEILARVRGKTAEEIGEILLSRPEVKEVEVRFSPFWVKQAPKLAKKIYLKVVEE